MRLGTPRGNAIRMLYAKSKVGVVPRGGGGAERVAECLSEHYRGESVFAKAASLHPEKNYAVGADLRDVLGID